MKHPSFCGSGEHVVSRRGFLGTLAAAGGLACADMTALQVLGSPAVADELRRNQKRCIVLWLAGGASQLETWDPKPGVRTGGPFASIQTNVPGVRISELMPKMARRLQNTCIIRSLNTRNADHATNIAEAVVYLKEGDIIRHTGGNESHGSQKTRMEE